MPIEIRRDKNIKDNNKDIDNDKYIYECNYEHIIDFIYETKVFNIFNDKNVFINFRYKYLLTDKWVANFVKNELNINKAIFRRYGKYNEKVNVRNELLMNIIYIVNQLNTLKDFINKKNKKDSDIDIDTEKLVKEIVIYNYLIDIIINRLALFNEQKYIYYSEILNYLRQNVLNDKEYKNFEHCNYIYIFEEIYNIYAYNYVDEYYIFNEGTFYDGCIYKYLLDFVDEIKNDNILGKNENILNGIKNLYLEKTYITYIDDKKKIEELISKYEFMKYIKKVNKLSELI